MNIGILDALQLPFMLLALATVTVLAVAAGIVGLGISFREMEFVSDGLVHAVFPGLCVKTGSGVINDLHRRMVTHRVDPARLPTPERD